MLGLMLVETARSARPRNSPADQRDREELRPDHVESGAAVEDGLGKRDEVRGGRCLHDGAQEGRHALERRIAPREHVHGNRDQHVQQARAAASSARRCRERCRSPSRRTDRSRRRPGTEGPSRRSERRAGRGRRKPATRPTATAITNPFDQIFDIAISKGVNGITSR